MYKVLIYHNLLRHLLLWFALFAASNVFAKGEYDYLLHKPYADRAQLFDTVTLPALLKLDSASFCRELKKIEMLAEAMHDEGLLMEVKLGYTNVRAEDPFNSRVQFFEELLNEAIKKKLKYYIVTIRFMYGQYLFNMRRNYEKAFECDILCRYELAKFTSKEMPNKKAILTFLGLAYYNFQDYNTAKQLLLTADTTSDGWRWNIPFECDNTLGMIYLRQKVYDSALYFFKKMTVQTKPSSQVWVGIAMGNIGAVYYLQGKYDEAVPYINYDIDTSYAYEQYSNGVIALTRLADIYIKRGNVHLAEQQLARGWLYIEKEEERESVMGLSHLYAAYAALYRAKNDYKQAMIFRDSAERYTALKKGLFDVKWPLVIKKKVDEEIHNSTVKKLNIEKKEIKRLLNELIIGLVLVFVIAYLIINRQRSRHKSQQAVLQSQAELAQSEKKLVETRLENATAQLASFTQYLKEKGQIVEKSASTLDAIEKTSGGEISNEERELILQQLLDATILTDEQWEEFKTLFDRVHSGYIERLKNKIPDITQAEIRYLVLSKLNLSNKEMGAILGVKPDTLRITKYRLRKKADMGNDSDMKELIDI